jgi:molybdate transport system regulatory protein
VLARIDAGLGGDAGPLFWSLGMRTSARNALRGVVLAVTDGTVNAEVSLEIAPGVEIVAVVTRPSVAELGLAPGKAAVALIKSSFVVLAKGEGLRTSARNQLQGRVIAREDGAVSTEVSLEIAKARR